MKGSIVKQTYIEAVRYQRAINKIARQAEQMAYEEYPNIYWKTADDETKEGWSKLYHQLSTKMAVDKGLRCI